MRASGGSVVAVVKNLAKALASIYFRVPRGIQFGLDDVRTACDRAGSPHLHVPVVHIAGTNGKGSVASMVASVLRTAGYRVGLFTSPHLCRFAERIQIDGSPLDNDSLTSALWQAIEVGPKLSFFETTFLAAMLAFRRLDVQVAVLEVGLGGRLDATNVVEHPTVTAVTRIALDHMDKLGRTEEEIAAEKAAIAKQGVPMVLGPMSAQVDRVCREHALGTGASEVLGVGREIAIERLQGHAMRVALSLGSVELRPSLLGAHQLENAAVAAAICAAASGKLDRVDSKAIEKGIADAVWPGRLERIRDEDGDVVLDAAHNPDGAQALAAYLRQSEARGPQSTALVFGAVADKSWKQMLSILAPLAEHRFYVEPGGRAGAPLVEMVETAGGTCEADVPSALAAARRSVGKHGLVVVAGSIFLAGNARCCLLRLDRDPPVAL
ncbi:MAG: bifunctional folylpolyglutamate synthase/dihydrofolate synthase [Deltaproteobacteria bacterium]|nr:bifunctional folylpolyglutamate synthase/dihydrofolate synthase [Deltaproteobacteria bacterium]